MRTVTVKADWDDEAQVWYVKESDLPSLHVEAETPVELRSKLPGAIEDLLEGSGEREVSKIITASPQPRALLRRGDSSRDPSWRWSPP
jgi:predicted RNase H-like HicB family nuclease